MQSGIEPVTFQSRWTALISFKAGLTAWGLNLSFCGFYFQCLVYFSFLLWFQLHVKCWVLSPFLVLLWQFPCCKRYIFGFIHRHFKLTRLFAGLLVTPAFWVTLHTETKQVRADLKLSFRCILIPGSSCSHILCDVLSSEAPVCSHCDGSITDAHSRSEQSHFIFRLFL